MVNYPVKISHFKLFYLDLGFCCFVYVHLPLHHLFMLKTFFIV